MISFPIRAIILLFIVFVIAACSNTSKTDEVIEGYGGTALDEVAPDFELRDQSGQIIHLSEYRGKIVVLTFFDSQCHDVCPLTGYQLVQTYQALGELSDAVVFMSVNVNLEANTLEDVSAASQHWGLDEIPDWHFLTGQAEELEPVWAAYHIEVVLSEEDITHTPGVYIIDPQGQLRWYISTPFVTAGTPAPSRPLHELLLLRIEQILSS